MSQFCTYHKSWAVVACAKLWPDWIIIFHARTIDIFTRFGSRVHKTLRDMGPLWSHIIMWLFISNNQRFNYLLSIKFLLAPDTRHMALWTFNPIYICLCYWTKTVTANSCSNFKWQSLIYPIAKWSGASKNCIQATGFQNRQSFPWNHT